MGRMTSYRNTYKIPLFTCAKHTPVTNKYARKAKLNEKNNKPKKVFNELKFKE